MSHLYPSYNRANLAFERGEGPWLFDRDGVRYFDFGSGIAVNALGHANPRLTAALADQASKLWHVSNLYTVPEQEKLAQMLAAHSFAEYVFFTNSGAEAVEAAIKTARRYHYDAGAPRAKIIAFEGSFHGRTLATIAAAGAKKLVEGFAPLPEGFVQIPVDADALAGAVDEDTAAILIEPVQGEGGIRVVGADFLRQIRAAADRVGALVIFDEIQCGMGRTGTLFAHQLYGVEPDIMALAKGIGGGFPLGACLANERAGRVMIAGTHGSTYGGNPLACRIGAEVMAVMTEDGFLDHVNRLAGHLRQSLGALVDRYPDLFDEVRGEGLLIGLKCKIDNTKVVNKGRDHHVLTVPASDNVIRLLPPLNVTIEELDAGVALLEAAAKELSA